MSRTRKDVLNKYILYVYLNCDHVCVCVCVCVCVRACVRACVPAVNHSSFDFARRDVHHKNQLRKPFQIK